MNPVLPIDLSDGLQLDTQLARSIGESLSDEYRLAEPFPHIVLDNFLPLSLVAGLQERFPAQPLKSDVIYDEGYLGYHKRQIAPADCDEYCRHAFDFFNSAPFLAFLEGLSSIQGLLSDPYFEGGGFHEIATGGKLGIHADFRINKKLHLNRRINVIVYLNEDWKDEYNGALELWNRDMSAKVKGIPPISNRCVIFNTDAHSYHGHPDPLTSPPGVFRRSLALYYYTASKAVYDETPDFGTMYRARPYDSASTKREATKLRMQQYIAQSVPPVLLRYLRSGLQRVKHRASRESETPS
ncbi:2OG-Fe(II) oxygenase [Mycobacterium sp. CVI_P3]|uniref:2OG-Fe(II) oxygenase n=1 Tax=Mycobacterium pinniadriaticum TaxID=2994102 RepID=A0ABT3S804_9MYCO|nr:2OG-Fe(II) oxygenase [Mycobacterium pinniadriaticum]MCX2928646.1 2OG-Fe(II) oxygenase [Mycobacterium pinniadriaticum]MCX2935487.1 2OG-Fe(II) oxygenase [Mycobacterium pinniadriaticum]